MKAFIILTLYLFTSCCSKEISHHRNLITRDPKLMFFLTITDEQCSTGESHDSFGTCMTYRECNNLGGISTATCSTFGTCCLIQKSCGEVTKANNTYFTNPDYPSANPNGGKCELIVDRATDNICQVRLDFLQLDISPPNSQSGFCEYDVMTVAGGTSTVPTICGENSGKHMYINVDPNGSAIKILVDADMNAHSQRKFNIKVTQLPCDSTSLAPAGCLQYFMTTSGTVETFNFPSDVSAVIGSENTHQLMYQEYSACVRPEAGYCSISWSPNDAKRPYSFFVSDKKEVIAEGLIGNVNAASYGERCKTDFVLIPGGQFENPLDVPILADRYCGPAFPDPVTTKFKPYTLYYKTDDTEEGIDSSNIGASLNFRQNLC